MKIGYINKKTFAIIAVSAIVLCSLLLIGILDGTQWSTKPSASATGKVQATVIPKATAKITDETDKDEFPDNLSQYSIVAAFNEDKKQINGTVEVVYQNKTGVTLNEIYFCLYPNAFTLEGNNGNVVPADWKSKAYPNGFSSGSIAVTDTMVNGKNAAATFEKDNQLMCIPVSKLKNNKTVKLSMTVSIQLPNMPMRFGYGEQTVNLGNWYPVVCVYEEDGWNKCLYNANGDPFYSDTSDYSIELSLPYEYKLASTGSILSKDTDNPLMTTWRIQAPAVRDFACVFSKDFKLKSRLVGSTIVYSYYLGDDAWGEKALQYGVDALKIYNEMFGKYPYNQLSIVGNDFFIGGMEYPNLVMVNKELYCKDTEAGLEEVTVHEVAHQWWYGLVGNDEINEAWLDEGLTQYSTMMYYEKTYGEDAFENKIIESEQYYETAILNLKDELGDISEEIDRPAYAFEDWRLYDVLTYDRAAMMLHTVRETVGEKKFFNSMAYYFEQNKYKNASQADFVSAFKTKSGVNITALLESWLDGKVVQPAA